MSVVYEYMCYMFILQYDLSFLFDLLMKDDHF